MQTLIFKKAVMTVSISDGDFRAMKISKDKEGYYIKIKISGRPWWHSG